MGWKKEKGMAEKQGKEVDVGMSQKKRTNWCEGGF